MCRLFEEQDEAASLRIMAPERISTEGSSAVDSIAGHYAAELDAQFRTLNHFVCHAGEIGRAHETFLRGVLARFLPNKVRLTSGFIAHPRWTSRQQDILMHERDMSTLFEVGDCVVIDFKSFIGTIEVKTQLPSAESLREAIENQAELNHRLGHGGLYAVYAWDGVSIDTALSVLLEFVRSARQHDVADWVGYIFGTSECPACDQHFRVLNAIGQ